MYEVLVKFQVITNTKLDEKTKQEVLFFLKKYMGGYSDFDIARIFEVVQVTKKG